MADGTWQFTGTTPISIGDFLAYRQELLLDPDCDITVLEIVTDLIDSFIIVDNALQRIKGNV